MSINFKVLSEYGFTELYEVLLVKSILILTHPLKDLMIINILKVTS